MSDSEEDEPSILRVACFGAVFYAIFIYTVLATTNFFTSEYFQSHVPSPMLRAALHWVGERLVQGVMVSLLVGLVLSLLSTLLHSSCFASSSDVEDSNPTRTPLFRGISVFVVNLAFVVFQLSYLHSAIPLDGTFLENSGALLVYILQGLAAVSVALLLPLSVVMGPRKAAQTLAVCSIFMFKITAEDWVCKFLEGLKRLWRLGLRARQRFFRT
ncbi:hypothetical protein C8R43DRAFT_993219 [Mycena crocata]|nr:hypothetical protein C8R43DRAFT_993219 [Mycena crocata]